jgi:uncharacterized membrane protein YadS
MAIVAARVYHKNPREAGRPKLPWFIALFVLAAAVRALVPTGMLGTLDGITHAARVSLVVTLFFIGAGLTRDRLAAVGLRPLVQGVLLWAVVASATLAVVLL